MRVPRALLSPAVLRRASRWYRFLIAYHREDVAQVAALVRAHALSGVEESRLADRELYRLAREMGWRRPAAGLQRGATGRWQKGV